MVAALPFGPIYVGFRQKLVEFSTQMLPVNERFFVGGTPRLGFSGIRIICISTSTEDMLPGCLSLTDGNPRVQLITRRNEQA